ncbi:archaeal/vacuolar-type H+-ATPase subunit I [Candidatus Methanoperedens nitroreducens]|uniref:A-type ATP synthase subunit I n=1 Tax=Candidatus Methanoperedens nitratireducens TaxID=1392998 RepID=A0A062UWG5_9EURY|nr:V-type ATP synthase subunit I [Candidatus Methanoperedens nitroreducens]KCZ71346.1 archaeal/vacuolar-type H+-ATPase subunit I [Candidatus Methanoperedens nitroreducens]MDJ1420975.1 V-type ATP synthase subunit I [Candidatus Methanoperedens sp.]
MLKPTKMTRVVIAGTKDTIEPVISTLHSLNMLHITDYTEENEDFKIGRPLKPASKLSEYLLSLRAISSQLGITGKEPASKQSSKELPSRIDEKITELQKEVSSRFDELRGIEFKIKEKEDLISAVKPFFGLPLSLEAYQGYETIKVYTGFISDDIEPKLLKITNNYELFTGEYEKRKIFALFIPKTYEDEIQKLLQDERSYVELKVPELKGNPPVILDQLTNEVSTLKENHASIRSELDTIKKEYSDFIMASDEFLSIETQKAEAPLRFATSANAFIIDGWVPSKKYNELESRLQESTNGKAYLTRLEEVNEEEIPIELENPTPAKPFELLINTFATPKYREIDPAVMLFITFPLFYAIMLGDVGYGIILAGLALVIKNKFKTGGLNALASILLLSAVLSVILGVIYGELFGFPLFNIEIKGHIEEGILGIAAPAIAGLHLPIHRFDSVQSLLMITLIIGILHISLGLIIGFRNVTIGHGLGHAIYAKGSWMLILIGGVVAIAKLMPSLMSGSSIRLNDPAIMAGMGLALIGIILLIKGEGFISIMEIPTLLSNVLSYARILAIGLSSAGIALAVNTLSMDLFIKPDHVLLGGGIGLALVGVVVLFIGHLINLILGVLGPGLHSLRLQYVEFFTKFYEGGGRKYIPFGYNRKYTEE